MKQAALIASTVAKGFAHVVRVGFLRKLGVTNAWPRASGVVRIRTDASWPQPSPISPNMPYSVLHVPKEELKEFYDVVVARFMRQVQYSWVAAIGYLHKKPYLDCPDDATLARYLTKTVYAYFLTDTLADEDRELLAKNGLPADGVHKADLAPVSTIEAFKGLYCCGSACFLKAGADGNFELLGIAMVDREFRMTELIRPTDGNAWKRAKMHVLQGATYLSLFVTHPKCHFPIDAVIAVTRTRLPETHRVYKLLAPHMYMQLPLDHAVLHIKNGPGFNDPKLYYTAFSGKGRSQYRLFEYSFVGMPGHAAFPAYTFGYLRGSKPTDYMRFLFGYYDVIYAFVSKVMADVPVDDVLIRWAKDCDHYSRGFLGEASASDKDRILECIATLVWNCSVVHSADHWDFYAIPMEHKPTRLRVAPPFERKEYSFEEKDLTQPEDRLRQFMWHELYVRNWNLKYLQEVDYRFDEPELKAANRDFIKALKTYEAGLPKHYNFIPLKSIGTSIQF